MLSTRTALCAIMLSTAAAAAPHASTRAAPECAGRHCILADWSDRAAGDFALLTVEGAAIPVRLYYASDEGAGTVKMVRDANGSDYVLLEYGVGRGTSPNKTVYLAVLHVGDRGIDLLRKVRLRYRITPTNSAEYRYAVVTPVGGGLTLSLTRHFTGQEGVWHFPPANLVVSIPPPD